jgi:hypothetical protein
LLRIHLTVEVTFVDSVRECENGHLHIQCVVYGTSIDDERVVRATPGREVGDLSAHPLAIYLLSLAERRYSIALRGTKTKGFRDRRI